LQPSLYDCLMTIAQRGSMTVLTKADFHWKNSWDVKKDRAGASPTGELIHFYGILGRTWFTVQKWKSLHDSRILGIRESAPARKPLAFMQVSTRCVTPCPSTCSGP